MDKFAMVDIDSISEINYDGDVFDLEVEKDHTYNIERVIVHNSGASCITRRVTGVGCPQLTAIMNCAPVLRERGVRVIADGGIRFSGDASKALWAGADSIMLGYVLSGHDECPTLGPNRIYRGMSSRTVSRRSDIAAEGVSFEVPNRGPVSNTIKEYAAAIRATCSLSNAMTLQQMRTNVNAIRVSTMSQSESDPVRGE